MSETDDSHRSQSEVRQLAVGQEIEVESGHGIIRGTVISIVDRPFPGYVLIRDHGGKETRIPTGVGWPAAPRGKS